MYINNFINNSPRKSFVIIDLLERILRLLCFTVALFVVMFSKVSVSSSCFVCRYVEQGICE